MRHSRMPCAFSHMPLHVLILSESGESSRSSTSSSSGASDAASIVDAGATLSQLFMASQSAGLEAQIEGEQKAVGVSGRPRVPYEAASAVTRRHRRSEGSDPVLLATPKITNYGARSSDRLRSGGSELSTARSVSRRHMKALARAARPAT